MGQCCATEERDEVSYPMAGGTEMKAQARVKAERGDGDEPDPKTVIQVEEMNMLSSRAQTKYESLGTLEKPDKAQGPYVQDIDFLDRDTQDLTYLGPYEYPDGSTYEGQFRYGLRNGWGKCVYADGSVYEGFFMDD